MHKQPPIMHTDQAFVTKSHILLHKSTDRKRQSEIDISAHNSYTSQVAFQSWTHVITVDVTIIYATPAGRISISVYG